MSLETTPLNAPTGPLETARRAAFLACSWTWCIGMFFPVYLVSDFGIWGWVAFAIPNIIGAAAMGRVLRRPGSSEHLTHRHARAAWWFSFVTILFHLYFLPWFVAGTLNVSWAGAQACVLLAVMGGIALTLLPSSGWWKAAPVVYGLSVIAAIGAFLSAGDGPGASLGLPTATPRHGTLDLLCAAPALVLGFALCPYLDLTFHRVRRETPGIAGERAFWIGFIGFFTPMIVFTLLYARGLSAPSIGPWVAAHVLVQSAFTIGAHARELLAARSARAALLGVRTTPARDAKFLAFAAACALAPILGQWLANQGLLGDEYSYKRLGYELFMATYALLFPAYVWIVMIDRGLTRRGALLAYFACLAPAGLCLWFGYIEQKHAWLPVGVLIVLATPMLARRVLKRA